MFLRKLVISNIQARRARTALTVAAIALSVSLVVAVTSGYASMQAAVRKFMDQYMGAIDAQVSRQNDPRGPVTERVVDELRRDTSVRRADGRVEIETNILNKDGKGLPGRPIQVFGVDRNAAKGGDPRIAALSIEAGRFFTSSDGNEAVIDQALAQRLMRDPEEDPEKEPPSGASPPAAPEPAVGADGYLPGEDPKKVLGTTLTLPGARKVTVTIVGVIRKPEIIAQQIQSIYLPLRTLQRFQGWDAAHPGGPQVNRVNIELAKGVDPRAWEQQWQQRMPTIDANLKLKLTRDSRGELDKQMGMISLLSYLGGTVSMLAATFIVFTSLSMGVSERQRTLAMLRAVGAFRSQVGWLVVIEGLMLAVAGVVIGVPLGWVWVKLLTLRFPDLFSAGVAVSWGGVALGSIGSILAALAASLLPAWWATRVSPLEAMAPDSKPASGGAPYRAAGVGLLLISIDPFVMFGPIERIARALGAGDAESAAMLARLLLHFSLGLPGVMIGFFLLAPLFVKVTETLFAPLVSRAMAVSPQLLRQQLSSGLWRAAGTCAALMVGLSVLVVMQVQGNSALRGWKLPTKFPDIFIVSKPGLFTKTGIEIERQDVLQSIPGIRGDEIMPIAIASPEFGHGFAAQAKVMMFPDATMFFGIDPAKAFRMMELEFRAGTAAEATRHWTEGRALWLKPDQTVVPSADFAIHGTDKDRRRVSTVKGVSVDDRGTPDDPADDQVVMQGLVADRGDVWQIDLVGGTSRTVPKAQVDRVERGRFLVVTNEFKELKGLGVGDDFPLRTTRKDVTTVHYTIVGVVWSPGIDVIVSTYDMGRQFDQRTAASVFGSLLDAKEDFGIERLYLFAANLEWDVQRVDLLKELKKRLRVEGLQAGDVRGIKEKITRALDRLLLMASSVAFAAMAVASLGVTNTVMAGVRTRRWQFGVLRSIGVTRGQLLRLVLSEAVLLGLVACALGLAAGGLMAIDAKHLQVLNTGYNPPIAVPWGMVSIGTGIVMFISLAASLWPAISVARTEPLALLQAGRAAA